MTRRGLLATVSAMFGARKAKALIPWSPKVDYRISGVSSKDFVDSAMANFAKQGIGADCTSRVLRIARINMATKTVMLEAA